MIKIQENVSKKIVDEIRRCLKSSRIKLKTTPACIIFEANEKEEFFGSNDRLDRRSIAIVSRGEMSHVQISCALTSLVSFSPRGLLAAILALAVYSLASGNYAKRNANFQNGALLESSLACARHTSLQLGSSRATGSRDNFSLSATHCRIVANCIPHRGAR